MKEIDARGLNCPQPVVKTKQALEEETEVMVKVDDQIQAENVAKLARQMKGEVTILEADDCYQITIKLAPNQEEKSRQTSSQKQKSGKVYFITNDQLGTGAKELGNVLMKGFLSTLLEINLLPEKIIFMNKGVKVPTLNQQAKKHLQELEKAGVTILSCGTCLDYYGLKDKLEVGSISNMYEILTAVNNNPVVEI